MKISEAAKAAGLTTKAARYYANIGLVVPHQNPETGYRLYSAGDVGKLQFVGRARRFNFSVDECRELLALYENDDRSSRDVKQLTLKKIAEIEGKLAELQLLKEQLSHLANNCEGDNRPGCPIIDALSV